MFTKCVSNYSGFAIDAIDRAINRSDCNIFMYTALTAKSDLEYFSPVTSSDEHVNILTTCFCFIFISSGSGCSGFTYMEIDRSIDRLL